MIPGRRRLRRCVRCRWGSAVATAKHVVGAEPRAHDVAAVHDVGVAPWPWLGVSQGRFGRSFGTEKACQVFLTIFKSSEAKNNMLKLIRILYICGA